MVERGGLDYPIRVRDEFSKTTALFRKELRQSKKEFREFQKALRTGRQGSASARELAKATRELAAARRALNEARRKSTKPLTDEEKAAAALAAQHKRELRNLALLAKAQRDRERRATALRNAQNADLRRQQALLKAQERKAAADKKSAQSTNVDFQAQRRLNAELFRQRVALKEIALLKAQASAQRLGGDLIGSQATLKRAQQLERSLVGSQKAATSMLFTFRRLVGTLAIFTLARKGVQAFNDLVREGVKFNDTIATAQLGIAGLVTTLGDVRDAQGQSVSKTEELNLALGIAREQTAKLRQDSLRTVATFQELLNTFQVSVGPGLAAGLNLDEVRQLTVDISQAAAALGVPQNQLAEEVRSLLSGTIQARTTRIATALGITNADVRRLKETGELFTFLEEEFSGFAEAAQRQARETFTGIGVLIKGIVQEILGNAAQPLFEELLDLGNKLFDNVLTIVDEAGNIRPNPDVVEAFQAIFNALRDGVVKARELASEIGVSGFQSALGAAGFALQVIVGALEVVVSLFRDVLSVVTLVKEQLGFSSTESSAVAQEIGKWGARLLIANALLGKINKKLLLAVKGPAILVAAFASVAKAIEFILEKIFGVNLNIRETIELISLGLLGAWFSVVEVVSVLGTTITTTLANALDTVITTAKNKASEGKGFIAALFGDDEASQRAATDRINRELDLAQRVAKRRKQAELEIADIRAQAAAKQKALEEEIAAVVGGAAGRGAQGEGFDPGFDAAKAAQEAADAAASFVSTADKPINELGESLTTVNDQIRKARLEFEQATAAAAAGAGAGGRGIVSAFNKEEIANAERLRKIRTALAETEREIARLRQEGVADTEGSLVTLLRDEKDLKDAIAVAEGTSLQLAALKAATVAERLLPAVREESVALQAQVAAERAKTAAVVAQAGPREMALVAARSAVQLAEAELAAMQLRNQTEQQALAAKAAQLPPGAELDSLNQIIEALAIRQGYEEEILRLRLEQLQAAEREAEKVANGSLTEGLKEGFTQFAEQFGSTFQAGINIVKQSLQAFTQFASQAIVDAFDPTKEVDIKERFARLMQQIAQTVLQQLIQLAIAKAILGFKDGGVVPEMNVNGIPLSFAKGGEVPEHWTRRAKGLAKGGFGRPRHVPASDTVPAWLTPGEFVVNRDATKKHFATLRAMNDGDMEVVGSSSAEAAGPSTAMAAGGLVSDRLSNVDQGSESSNGDGDLVVVPAVVASDREMDTFSAGGRNALFAFMRENAGNINALLDRGATGRGR